MKKLHTLTFIFSFLIASTANAQINKGATFLGGDLSFGGGKHKRDGNELNNSTYIGVSTVFGKAVRQNLILGVDIMFVRNKHQPSPGPRGSSYSYGLGTFLRKYGQLGKSGFSLFLQGRLGAAHQKLETVGSNTDRMLTISLSAFPGLSYRVSRKLQIETGFNNLVSIGYSRSKRTTGGAQPTTDIFTNFGMSTSSNNLAELYAGFRLLIN